MPSAADPDKAARAKRDNAAWGLLDHGTPYNGKMPPASRGFSDLLDFVSPATSSGQEV
jgi:hypothetical protein